MRLLAERLETGTATLYRHFAGKDELMVHVVDRMLAGVLSAAALEEEPPRTWQDAMRRRASQFRSAVTEHPNVLPLLVAQLQIGPNALQLREQSIATLVELGFSPPLAAGAYTAIVQYVVGFLILQPGSPGPREAAAIADYFRALDAERYPFTVAGADALTDVSPEDEFVAGLQFILDGIDRARRRR